MEVIAARLRRVDTLNRLPHSVLQQLAVSGYYEDLERGVTRKLPHLDVVVNLTNRKRNNTNKMCMSF